jgi:hypothetical protein
MRILLILFLLASFLLPAAFKRLTHGFSLKKAEIELPYVSEWDEPIVEREKLNQPFHYLARGAQSYVFESEDQTFVLKLFRFDRTLPSLFDRLLGKKHRLTESYEKAFQVMEAAHLARTLLPDETALFYVHLNIGSTALPSITMTDPIGRKKEIDLNSYRFALQKRATRFDEAISRCPTEEIRARLSSLLALLEKRARQGIRNLDPSLVKNFGFIQDKAVEIDFGRFVYDPSMQEGENWTLERARHLDKLNRWLEKNALGDYTQHP